MPYAYIFLLSTIVKIPLLFSFFKILALIMVLNCKKKDRLRHRGKDLIYTKNRSHNSYLKSHFFKRMFWLIVDQNSTFLSSNDDQKWMRNLRNVKYMKTD